MERLRTLQRSWQRYSVVASVKRVAAIGSALITRSFWHLVGELPAYHAENLVQAGRKQSMFWWNPEEKELQIATEVPWPVHWLLASYSKKHIFTKYAPEPMHISRAMELWRNKLKWRIMLEGSDQTFIETSANGSKFNITVVKSKFRTPPCEHDTPIDSIIQSIHHDILDKAVTSKHMFTPRFPLLVHQALQYIKSCNFVFVPTDKDGGYVCTSNQLFHDERVRVLNTSDYVAIPRTASLTRDLIYEFKILCRKYCDTFKKKKHGNRLLEVLIRDCRHRNDNDIIAKLLFTCKTHKPAGEVEPRAIHANSKSPFKPAMRLIARTIRPYVLEIEHLMADSRDFVKLINSTYIPHDHVLCKVDIKNFFMSGEQPAIADSCSLTSLENRQHAFRKLHEFVLTNQLVEMDEKSEKVFKVKVGSGMGLECSGEANNFLFYRKAERNFVTNKNVREQFCLSSYARYQDDIFYTIGGTKDSRMRFFRILKRKAGFYKLIMESISQSSAVFLDMHVSKGGRHGTSGLLEIGSYKKPSSQKVPLHSTSAHHQSVHKSWPLCRLNHFENITTSYEGCMKAKTEFVIELVNKAAGHAALPLVFQQIAGETGVIARESKPCSWLVLPFHIAYEGARLHDILLSYRDTWPTAYAHLFPRIAWRLIEPSIQSRMQRHLQLQP